MTNSTFNQTCANDGSVSGYDVCMCTLYSITVLGSYTKVTVLHSVWILNYPNRTLVRHHM